MTAYVASQPPPPPAAPPSPREAARLAEENAALAAQLSNQALREAVGEGAAQSPAAGVVRDGAGRVVVTTRDGRQVIIDPAAVGNSDVAVRALVEQAFAPTAPSRGRGGTSGEDVAVVAIIFPCLIVLMLIVWRIVATAKRPGAAAGAGVPAELAGRLARIEQAIEAVAIEVERIAESERYSARLLTERLPQARPDLQPAVQPPPARADAPTANVPR